MIFVGLLIGMIASCSYGSELHYLELAPLACACTLVACEPYVVEVFCKAGVNPNFKSRGGLYPATCCMRSLIQLYATNDDHRVAYINNQVKKFEILYSAVQDAENEGEKVPLIINHSVKELLTQDIERWLHDLLVRCAYPSKPAQ